MDLRAIQVEIDELIKKLSRPEFLSSSQSEAKKSGARLRDLQKKIDLITLLQKTEKELEETRTMISENDPTLRDLAKSEEAELVLDLERMKLELLNMDSPGTENESDNLIMEIRAGAGGNEASLFAEELSKAYTRFAESRGWVVNLLSKSESEAGGFKEIIFQIAGDGAYKTMRYESGVHRVQRIPTTEKQGRIHTSTVSVAVLPQVEEVDFEIRPQDLKIEFFRSSGAGGQNVNKVETAVRITHVPTGFVVTSQEGRSQLKNREHAMTLLRARIYDVKRAAEEKKLSVERKSQIGTGDRSEKIRTYNFPQDRVTDHRIGESFHNIEKIMEGYLGDIVEAISKGHSPK